MLARLMFARGIHVPEPRRNPHSIFQRILTPALFETVSKTRMRLARTLLINPDGTPRSTIEWDKPNNQQQLRENEADPEEQSPPTGAA